MNQNDINEIRERLGWEQLATKRRKMPTKPVVVKQEEESPIAVEVLAKSIIEFEKGVQRIEKAGLTHRAIAILLKDAIPCAINMSQIIAVLEYLPQLSRLYMKKIPAKGTR